MISPIHFTQNLYKKILYYKTTGNASLKCIGYHSSIRQHWRDALVVDCDLQVYLVFRIWRRNLACRKLHPAINADTEDIKRINRTMLTNIISTLHFLIPFEFIEHTCKLVLYVFNHYYIKNVASSDCCVCVAVSVWCCVFY